MQLFLNKLIHGEPFNTAMKRNAAEDTNCKTKSKWKSYGKKFIQAHEIGPYKNSKLVKV